MGWKRDSWRRFSPLEVVDRLRIAIMHSHWVGNFPEIEPVVKKNVVQRGGAGGDCFERASQSINQGCTVRNDDRKEMEGG